MPRAILEDEPSFSITGDPIPGAPFLANFNTNLTVLVLTLDLHNSSIFCGTQGNLHSVNFTIRVYGKY